MALESDRSLIKQKTISDLTRKEKIGFFIVNFGNIPIMSLMNTFLLTFYITVVGLDAVAIGLLFLIARVLDGLNDPIMGFVVDHLPKTKLGRFRSYIIIGSIICCINYLILWLGPALAISGKLIIAYITYLLFGFTFDLMDIPLNSMIPVMSNKDKDRNSLSNIKGLAYMMGTGLFIMAPISFLDLFKSNATIGYTLLVILTVIIVLSFSIIGALLIKERVEPIIEKKYTIQETIKVIGNRPVFVLFLETLMNSIGGGMTQGLLLIFFTYVFLDAELMIVSYVFGGIGLFIGLLFTNKLIARLGKKNAKIIADGFSVFGIFILLVPTNQLVVFIIIMGIANMGIGINMLLNYGIQADNMDYIEWKLGYRAEGAVASANSFIVKAAQGIGSSLAAFGLAIIGFNKDLPIQSANTIQGLYLLCFGIPAIFYLVGMLIFLFLYPLNKKTREEMMLYIRNLHQNLKVETLK